MDNEYLLPKELLQSVPNTSEHLWLFLSAEYDETSAISKPEREPDMISRKMTFGKLYKLHAGSKLNNLGEEPLRSPLPAGCTGSEKMVVYREGTRYYILCGGGYFGMLKRVYEDPCVDESLRKELSSKRISIIYYENLRFESLQYLIAKYNCPERIIADETPSAELPVQDPAKEPEAPAVSEDPVTSEAEKSFVGSRGLSVNILSTFILEQAKYSKELSCTPKKTAAIRQNRHAGSSCIGLVSAVHRKLSNRWYWQCGPPPDLPAAG